MKLAFIYYLLAFIFNFSLEGSEYVKLKKRAQPSSPSEDSLIFNAFEEPTIENSPILPEASVFEIDEYNSDSSDDASLKKILNSERTDFFSIPSPCSIDSFDLSGEDDNDYSLTYSLTYFSTLHSTLGLALGSTSIIHSVEGTIKHDFPGMYNPGLACWGNALLQGIFATPSLSTILQNLEPLLEPLVGDQALLEVVQWNHTFSALKQFFSLYQQHLDTSEILRLPEHPGDQPFARSIQHFIDPDAVHIQQQDPSQAYKLLIEKIVLLNADYSEKFITTQTTITTCNHGHASITEEKNPVIDLPIFSQDEKIPLVLSELITSYEKEEKLENVNQFACNGCGCIHCPEELPLAARVSCHGHEGRSVSYKKSDGTRKITINPPEILALNLLRYRYDLALSRMVKIKTPIHVDKHLDIQGHLYELRSILLHSGEDIHGGHWVSMVRKPRIELGADGVITAYESTDVWRFLNDEIAFDGLGIFPTADDEELEHLYINENSRFHPTMFIYERV